MKSTETPSPGRSIWEIISRLLGYVDGSMTIALGTIEVVVRVGNSAQGKRITRKRSS